MLWLERPPILRWLAATALVVVTAWVELAPPAGVPHYFLAHDVAAGTPLNASMVEVKYVPAPPFETVPAGGMAIVDLRKGDPLTPSVISEVVVPPDWVLIAAPLPDHAVAGAAATGLILDPDATPLQFPAVVVAAGGDDPFGPGGGTLAVPPDWLSRAAAAVAEDRLVVGITSHGG